MLQFIRDNATGWIAWGIVILISIPFALWGIHQYVAPESSVAVATVDDVEIGYYDYQRAYARRRQQLQSILGSGLIGDEEDAALRRDVLDVGVEVDVLAAVGDAPPVFHEDQEPHVEKNISVPDFALCLSDIVPNPWQAARIAEELIEGLKTSGETDEKIYDRRSYLIPTLQEHVANEVEDQAEQIFRTKLDSGEIQFDLDVDEPNYKLRQSYKIEVHANQNQLAKYGKPVQISLFEPMYEYPSDNEWEKNVAHFLDGEKALQWWHRVVARQQGEYYVQGWNKQRIYPDFVAMAKEVEGMTRVLIFETKGPQFEGNRDTEYKRKVLKTLEEAFNVTNDAKMRETPTQTGIFRLVFNAQEFPEISAQLNDGRYSTES